MKISENLFLAHSFSWLSIAGLFVSAGVWFSGEVSLAAEAPGVFRYHVAIEPASLDPTRLTSGDANYFYNNIMRGLYSYSNEKGLINEGAESCVYEDPLKLVCRLRSGEAWSDGSPILAEDYVRTFRRLARASKNPSLDLLKNLKNLSKVSLGELPPESLGVRVLGKDKLIFEFSRPDPDFLYKLTESNLVPSKIDDYPAQGVVEGLLFNGPYRVVSWDKRRRLRLEANPYYKRGRAGRPPVEVLFVDDDQTALGLYEQKTLTFLRQLPTTYIRKYRDRKDFFQIPLSRFDYVGFGAELKDQPHLRAALSHAANFAELKVLYDALGIPGCPGIPAEMMAQVPCVSFDLKRAKAAFAKVSESARKRRYKFIFSKLGGDDIKKGMEWLQDQWKKNLGLHVDLEQAEHGVYLRRLRADPPALFRKGVNLGRPTCLAALETFAKDGSENFLRLNDPDYEKILADLAEAKAPTKAKALCTKGVRYLLERNLLIPLGRIHFTILASPAFTGWTLNEMNQLDLSGLSFKL